MSSGQGVRLRPVERRSNWHVSWQELLLDCVFALTLSHAGYVMQEDLTLRSVFIGAGLLVPVWWAWVSQVLYASRFEHHDVSSRLAVFGTIFSACMMAYGLRTFQPDRPEVFGLGYLMSRAILWGMLYRAHASLPDDRAGTRPMLRGFGVGIGLWLLGFWWPGAWRWVAWVCSILVEFTASWWGRWSRLPAPISLESAVRPERFGWLVMLLLGQALAEAITGFSGLRWSGMTFGAVVLGFVIAILVWWSYFSLTDRAGPRLARRAGHAYMVAHLLLLLAIVAMGAGVQQAVGSLRDAHLALAPLALVCGGAALWVLAIWVLSRLLRPDAQPARLAQRYLSAIAGLLAVAVVGYASESVVVLVGVAALGFGLLIDDLRLDDTKEA